MGNFFICCGCLPDKLNEFMTKFIEDFKITSYKDIEFFAFTEKYPPVKNINKNFEEFFECKETLIHKTYKNTLFRESNNYLFTALIFLMKSEPIDKSSNYKAMIQKIKKSEISLENLENFEKNDYKVLSSVLKFYIKIVSLYIIEAAIMSKIDYFSIQQTKFFSEAYSLTIIDLVTKDLLEGFDDIDEFFIKNNEKLKHDNIRLLLKSKYLSVLKNKDKDK